MKHYTIKRSLLLFAAVSSAFLCSCGAKTVVSGTENNESVIYNNVKYSSTVFYNADSDRTLLGKAETGADVYAVGKTDPPDFLLIEGSDNSGCFAAPGANVPTSGTVTKILIDPGVRADNSKSLCSKDEISMIKEITDLKGDLQQFTVHNYFTEGNAFYYEFNDSKVSCEKNYGGYICFADEKWIFVPPDADNIVHLDNNEVKVNGIIIEDSELIGRMCLTDLVKYINY